MINSQSQSSTNLNDVLAFLNYQGPLYLRRIENLPPTPVKISSVPGIANLI